MAESLQLELNSIDETLKGYEADIAKLQGKLREARARQNAIATRIESAVTAPGRRDHPRQPHRRCLLALRATGAARRLRRRPGRRAGDDPGPKKAWKRKLPIFARPTARSMPSWKR